MAALHRAVALAEREHAPVRVGEQLHLDVARPLEVALEVDAVVAERGRRLALGRFERLGELAARADDAHAAPAAARSRLHDQGRLVALRDRGHAGRAREPLRLELVAARAQRVGRRPDPGEPGRVDRLREVGALGEEAVAGMNRVGAALGARRAGARAASRYDAISTDLVGRARVQRAGVVGRGDRDGLEAERPRGAEDAQRDLAAVRDEHLLHGRDARRSKGAATGARRA